MSEFSSFQGTWHEQTCSNTPVTKPSAWQAPCHSVVQCITRLRSSLIESTAALSLEDKGNLSNNTPAEHLEGDACTQPRWWHTQPSEWRHLKRSHLRTNAHTLAHHPTYPLLTRRTRLWHTESTQWQIRSGSQGIEEDRGRRPRRRRAKGGFTRQTREQATEGA